MPLFRSDPLKKLQKQLASKLEAARDAQRGGNMPRYAALTEEAERIAQQIDEIEAKQG